LRIVLDTNVLVSGLLSSSGPPREILRLLETAPIVPCLNESIVVEYRDVLARPRLALPVSAVANLLLLLESVGEHIPTGPYSVSLPDPDDEVFLAVALAAHADFLVTGNLRDFPARLRQGVAVVSPREFIDALHRR